MFNDIKLSEKMPEEFKNATKNPENNQIEIELAILTEGTWNIQETPACNLPAELKSLQDRFVYFYSEKNKMRKLIWKYQYGQVDMISN